MEILKKILDVILGFLRFRQEAKIEEQETNAVIVNQKKKTQDALRERKKIEPKPPKKEDFFNDDQW